MCDFSPGDQVKYVGGLRIVDVPGVTIPNEDRLYTVSDVKTDHPDGHPRCRISGLSAGKTKDEWWWQQCIFRRVYRPKADLISKLLEPIKEGAR